METYVIGGGQCAIGSADLTAGIFEALKGLLYAACQHSTFRQPLFHRSSGHSMAVDVRRKHTGDVTSWTKCLSSNPPPVSLTHHGARKGKRHNEPM